MYRNRPRKRVRQHKLTKYDIQQKVGLIISDHNDPGLVHKLKTLLFSLPTRKLAIIIDITDNLLVDGIIPKHIPLIMRDIAHFRLGMHILKEDSVKEKSTNNFIKVQFHNKGLDMINLSGILHHRSIVDSIPTFIVNKSPPIVSYLYTKPIAGKIFNFKRCLRDLDFDVGTKNLICDCQDSRFKYGPAGHVLTGNLSIIRNRKLRKLLSIGPSYREQNNIKI